MHDVHHPDLATLLKTVRPASLLLIDPHPAALPDPAPPQTQRLSGDLLAQLQTAGRFDLGIVANTLEHLDRKTAGAVLARLRDLHTRRFVVLAPIGERWDNQQSHWHSADFLGYGMTLMARYRVDDKPLHLYHYAIESYKTTPEWFNSHHWAHPERWQP